MSPILISPDDQLNKKPETRRRCKKRYACACLGSSKRCGPSHRCEWRTEPTGDTHQKVREERSVIEMLNIITKLAGLTWLWLTSIVAIIARGLASYSVISNSPVNRSFDIYIYICIYIYLYIYVYMYISNDRLTGLLLMTE